MLQRLVPIIRAISVKISDCFIELDEAIEQEDRDEGHIARLQEKQRKYLNTRGRQVLSAIRQWANQSLEVRLPESFIAELDAAIESLKGPEPLRAVISSSRATTLLVQDVDYDSMSIQEAARIAYLVSALAEFSDAFLAYRSREPAVHPRGVMADHAVVAVAKQGGNVEDLVSLLAEVFFDYGQVLGAPKDISVSDLRSLLPDCVESANLPGVCLAIWAATHGQLSDLNDAIQFGVALLTTNRTWSFDNNTQQHRIEN